MRKILSYILLTGIGIILSVALLELGLRVYLSLWGTEEQRAKYLYSW